MDHYLMVHDLVWISTTVTGQTVSFDYQKLEAVVAAQYDYGAQSDARRCAAQVLQCLLTAPAFAHGNRRTAFVAVTTLLAANGVGVTVSDEDAVRIIGTTAAGERTADSAVEALAGPEAAGFRPGTTLRQLVAHMCNVYAGALARLAEGD